MKKDDRTICVRNGITYRMAPFDGQQAVEQRLRNIIKLAIGVGRREGLIGNHKEDGIEESEGGQDVANKGNIRDRKAAPSRQGKAGNHEGE